MALTLDQLELQERIRQAPSALLAARIKRARRAAHINGETLCLSHDELVKRMGRSNRGHLIKLEQAKHRPRADLLLCIAEATGRQAEWFLDPDIEPSPFPESA